MYEDEMLTTVDNPYNPFDQFSEWYAYDTQKGHYTCELLARFAKTSDELTDEENSEEIHNAMVSIIAIDPENKYKIIKNH